jgi:hypothetical protein
MSMIQPSDPDFQVSWADFETLVELQLLAEQNGWGARWSSVEALRAQVGERDVLFMSFMRQAHGRGVQTIRCLVLFSKVDDGGSLGGLATLDVDPERYAALERIDHDPSVRAAFAEVFVLGAGGIELVSKG